MATAVEAGPQERLVFLKVSWATYEAIVFDLDGRTSGARLAYDGETLELMAPLNDHEAYVSLLDLLLGALMLEWEINLYCTPSSTLKAEPVGAEPDTSYYIEHAGQVGPPPDLVVEVDISHQRMDKLALYAQFGVPEFWRYGRAGLEAFALRDNVYHEIAVSTVIPGLPLAALGAFLVRRLEANRRQVLKDWQTWLRANRPTQA